MEQQKKRSLAVQTRLDARDFCVLAECFPLSGEGERTISNVMRFFLESAVTALCKNGAARPMTVREALDRLEVTGISLAQLKTTNPESARTRRIVETEGMAELLSNTLKEPHTSEVEILNPEFSEMAKEVARLLGKEAE